MSTDFLFAADFDCLDVDYYSGSHEGGSADQIQMLAVNELHKKETGRYTSAVVKGTYSPFTYDFTQEFPPPLSTKDGRGQVMRPTRQTVKPSSTENDGTSIKDWIQIELLMLDYSTVCQATEIFRLQGITSLIQLKECKYEGVLSVERLSSILYDSRVLNIITITLLMKAFRGL
jgi:hypothetical protein